MHEFNKFIIVAGVYLCFFLMPNTAQAQLLRVLNLNESRVELQLTDEQIESCENLIARVRDEENHVRRNLTRGITYNQLSSAEQKVVDRQLKAYFAEADEKQEQEIATILSEEQLVRLKQLRVQAFGASAFLSGPISELLEITDEQKTELRQAGAEFQKVFRDEKQKLVEAGEFFTGTDQAAIQTTLIQEYNRRLIDVLLTNITEEQRDKYLELRGEPIEIPMQANLR